MNVKVLFSDKMSDDSGVPTKGVVVVVFSPNKRRDVSVVASKHKGNGGGLFSKRRSNGCGLFHQ